MDKDTELDPTLPHPNRISLFSFLPIYIISIFSALLLGFLIGKGTNLTKNNNLCIPPAQNIIPATPTTTVQTTPTITPQTSPTQPPMNEKYIKRQYGPLDKFFINKSYPSEILNYKDNQLIGLFCTPSYINKQEFDDKASFSFYYYDEVSKQNFDLSNPYLIDLTLKAKKIATKTIYRIQYCKTETGIEIFTYNIAPDTGGPAWNTYFTRVENNELKLVGSIPASQWAYSICTKPLQITVNNDYYYQCGAGDGAFSMAEIYKINLASKSFSSIYQCTFDGTKDDGNNSGLVCK